MNKWLVTFLCVSLLLTVACNPSPYSGNSLNGREKLQTVKFGMLPYGDHTQAIIGVRKGWFEEVGIRLDYQVIKIDNIIPYLKNGSLDVCSSPPGLLFPAYESASGLGVFVFSDLFQGFAIMAQPSIGAKSYTEFLSEGLSSEEAFRAVGVQLKNKVFAYPSETAIKPFIDSVIEKSGLSKDDFTSLVQDDALTVNSMRNKQADFQVGGAPSRIVLTREGFKPIITAVDLAKNAEPSYKSRDLASIIEDGWATTRQMFEEKKDILLRLASVNFRINKLINEHPKEALEIHMPFLTKVTGETFKVADGEIIYRDLDPFLTFEQQRPWFHDNSNPLYYKHANGAALQSFIDKGVYKNTTPDVEEFIYADEIYYEMERLKAAAEELFGQIDVKIGREKNDDWVNLYQQARHQYDIYNYYDAERMAHQLLDTMKGK